MERLSNNIDIKSETHRILGERAVSKYDSKMLVDWAVNLMMHGYESPSIIILAGLDYDSTEEREKYFWKSIEELNIDINIERLELIDNYVIELAHRVVNNITNPLNAMRLINDVLIETQYDSKYFDFFYLSEDIDNIQYNGEAFYNSNLTKNNMDDFIKKEFELFLQYRNIQYDESLHEKAFCNNCHQVSNPVLKTKYQFKTPFSYKIYKCSKCNSSNIEFFSSQSGKIKILETLNKPMKK